MLKGFCCCREHDRVRRNKFCSLDSLNLFSSSDLRRLCVYREVGIGSRKLHMIDMARSGFNDPDRRVTSNTIPRRCNDEPPCKVQPPGGKNVQVVCPTHLACSTENLRMLSG